MSTPLISVITVVYNGENVLERTIRSVLQQTYTNIEYLVIDGGSADGTVEVIKKYAAAVRRLNWVSEKDRGIYDAMNKGMKMAKGDYLLFLNAGDELFSPDTLQNIFNPASGILQDVFYGETMFVDFQGKESGKRSELTPHQLPEKLSWKNLARGMVVCHQSFIVKKSIAPLYNLKYKYTADIDWMIACLKNSKEIVNTNLIVSNFLTGGFSKKNHFSSLMERFTVLQKHFGLIPTLFNHIIILARGILFAMKN